LIFVKKKFDGSSESSEFEPLNRIWFDFPIYKCNKYTNIASRRRYNKNTVVKSANDAKNDELTNEKSIKNAEKTVKGEEKKGGDEGGGKKSGGENTVGKIKGKRITILLR